MKIDADIAGAPGVQTAGLTQSLKRLSQRIPASTVDRQGRIVKAIGTSLRVVGLDAKIGQRVAISGSAESAPVYADVVGIENDQLLLYPLGSIDGIAADSTVRLLGRDHQLKFSSAMCGIVFDGFGNPLDGSELPEPEILLPLNAAAPSPLNRTPIDQIFTTGVRAIDGLLTIGRGQRIGIFAAAGAGKSTLLSMLAKSASVDVIVIALIGERGREVGEFINHDLCPEILKRTVTVVATSDRPAMERVLAARSATAVAEGFRAQGKSVLLLMDSVTRYARALREIGLSIGEPPARRGFPPSVFADLPQLFERAGNSDKGSITAFYTVLTEDEEANDPIAEEVRSMLDGHIMLSRKLGEIAHYPAIDVLSSSSRLFMSLAASEHQSAAVHLRKLLGKYAEVEFLVQVGEYTPGSDSLADEALEKYPTIQEFLQQQRDSSESFEHSIAQLELIAA